METIAREQPTVAIPRCVLGTPIEGTGTVLDGINQVNNMPLFEAEDAAMAALQKWVTAGVQPPHSPPISTTSQLFGLYDTVNLDQYGNALGGIRLPEIQVPTEFYSPINFSQTSASDLNPIALLSEVTSALTALSTGSIDDPTVRAAGLCLLSGYFTPLAGSTTTRLYPTHSAVRVPVHGRRQRRGGRRLPDARRRRDRDRRGPGRPDPLTQPRCSSGRPRGRSGSNQAERPVHIGRRSDVSIVTRGQPIVNADDQALDAE